MVDTPHPDLTDPDLHEPKGISTANNGELYFADGAGSGAWAAPVEPTFMQKHIAGLTWSNAADASNDITILAGSARDTTNTEDITLSASITKRIDAAWAVGNDQGGLDTGAVANTTYHIWLIKRTDTDVVDALFSTSATAPTMPANYDKKRRIGSFVRVAGVNQPVQVQELGGGAIQVSLTANTTTTSISFTATQGNKTITGLPTGVAFDAQLVFAPPGGSSVWVGTPGQTSNTTFVQLDSANTSIKEMWILTNTAAQISADGNGSSTVSTLLSGWKDFRRD